LPRIPYLIFSLIFALGIFIPNESMAMLKLKVTLTHKLGIDKNLVLKSELHSVEEFLGNEEVTVTMKNGFELKIFADYIEENSGIGPTDLIQIKATLFNPDGYKIKEFLGEEARVSLWKSKKFIYNGNIGQEIEIIIIPEPN
jgi:hypothetical protein